MNIMIRNGGWVEVICGCMFSGKSEELIRRLRRAEIARQKVMAIKPIIDDRYLGVEMICSHSNQQAECVPLSRAQDILALLEPDTQVVGIDEVQFFGPEVVPIIEEMAQRGLRVICAGLDADYRGEPWHPMPELLARAEFIEKMLAVCVECGGPASRTQRKIASADLVLIGSGDLYEARCRHCHYVPEEVGEQTEFLPGAGA